MESFPFTLGSQWEENSGSLVSVLQNANQAAHNSYHHQVTNPPTGNANIDDPLFDGHLVPLAEDERPYLSSGQGLSRPIGETQRKRSHEETCLPLQPGDIVAPGPYPEWFQTIFPDLLPSTPLITDRKIPHCLANPFHHGNTVTHPRLRSRAKTLFNVADGAINGLVKFRIHFKSDKSTSWRSRQNWFADEARQSVQQTNPFLNPAPNLPPDFGRGIKLDATDAKLLKFYTIAFCAGRTLLPGSNCFLNEITAMACANPCVRHGLLALASTYVLDYLPSKALEKRANMHYQRSVVLLSQELNKEATYLPGKEDVVLATLVLLSVNDLVNWEGNQVSSASPEWLTGNRMAKTVLDLSDPGYRFQHPENVQYTNVRRYMGGKAALVDIFCSTMAPLELVQAKCPYPWLLEGTEREMRKIDGLNGLAPKLLHMYAQITHLSARLAMDPTSIVIPRAAKILEQRLRNFWQWSEFSEGYRTPSALLASCILGPDGKVSDPKKVTELTGECYVLSAEVYLQCRLFRRPRQDPIVQDLAKRLLVCIERLPTEGQTFTAMAPMFSIFVAGLIVFRNEDREVIQNWFIRVIKGTRGNVPPAWQALQTVWKWQDLTLQAEESIDKDTTSREILDDDTRLAERRAWWEEMVWEIDGSVGKMNLA